MLSNLFPFPWRKRPVVSTSALLGLYAIFFGMALAFSKLINDPIDRAILLACNPDCYVPVVDEFMIFLTDYGKHIIAAAFIWWMVARLFGRITRRPQWRMPFLCAVGVIYSGLIFKDYLHSKYTLTIVQLAFAVVILVEFCWLAQSFVRAKEETIRRFAAIFWVMLLSVVLTNFVGEMNIKPIIKRHRPLHETNASWNAEIRRLPDEVVRGSFSYLSGHASSVFAMIAPLFWMIRNRKIRAALLLYAALHAYTRIYVAAHFPYCTLMGSLFGFGVGTLVTWSILGWARPPDPPEETTEELPA